MEKIERLGKTVETRPLVRIDESLERLSAPKLPGGDVYERGNPHQTKECNLKRNQKVLWGGLHPPPYLPSWTFLPTFSTFITHHHQVVQSTTTSPNRKLMISSDNAPGI